MALTQSVVQMATAVAGEEAAITLFRKFWPLPVTIDAFVVQPEKPTESPEQ